MGMQWLQAGCFSMVFSLDLLPPQSFLKSLDGKKISINDLNNTPMVINFWFLACGPCVKEMKFLNKWNDEYKEDGFSE